MADLRLGGVCVHAKSFGTCDICMGAAEIRRTQPTTTNTPSMSAAQIAALVGRGLIAMLENDNVKAASIFKEASQQLHTW